MCLCVCTLAHYRLIHTVWHNLTTTVSRIEWAKGNQFYVMIYSVIIPTDCDLGPGLQHTWPHMMRAGRTDRPTDRASIVLPCKGGQSREGLQTMLYDAHSGQKPGQLIGLFSLKLGKRTNDPMKCISLIHILLQIYINKMHTNDSMTPRNGRADRSSLSLCLILFVLLGDLVGTFLSISHLSISRHRL